MTLTLTHSDLKHAVTNAKGMIVEDMLQEETVNILVGDSGLGKSPLLMQLGLSVAAGVPFLDLPTRPGPVLYVDYENAISDLDATIDALLIHLNLPTCPPSFRFLHFPPSTSAVTAAIASLHPSLVIIDALRGLNPGAERDNPAAAACISSLQRIAEAHHCTFLLLHHTRKLNRDPAAASPKLSASPSAADWLQEASGARALVNQTAARFGIESHTVGDSDLLLRGHFKLKGEVGPFHLSRVYDEEGNPQGYIRLTGLSLLTQLERDRFAKLPQTFTWREASELLFPGKRVGKSLASLLARSKAAGLLRKVGEIKHLRYVKTLPL